MDFYYSLTSPYARVVRVALMEKERNDAVTHHVVNPWEDAPELVRANPLVRVPTLVTDDGTPLTECLLLIRFLEREWPSHSLLPKTGYSRNMSEAGLAMGLIDTAVHKLLGRKIAGDAFDESALGQRRNRAVVSALDAMDKAPPGPFPELGAIATLVALDYLAFRFPEFDWPKGRPALTAWHADHAGRSSVTETAPRDG
ncbi:glutathione S-transferase [Aquisalimonas sp. 2447]|uniref:glutathione S-transferase family protein n=1 Tax=Aquisalimonas sp. 2447 TaxID=2740807 RepID=UPI0014325D41|nr:glutathione S-transferase family protein [Aquisalimonas sp. 2447]QIT54641.1 glutathione S-transferase [Aquisalimonas sp. 2447]